jgi:hypothetical protein
MEYTSVFTEIRNNSPSWLALWVRVKVNVFNTSFNNISVILWQRLAL